MGGLKAQYEALARYNRWMNERVYTLADAMGDDARRRDVGAYFGSIHRTLNHLLLADRAWMLRFTGDDDRYASRDPSGTVIEVRSLGQELYASFDALRRERARTDSDIEAWVASLTAERLEGTLRYSRAGKEYEHPLWWAVGHLFNHQTHHRAQVGTLMKQMGHDPGVTDLISLLRGDA